MVTVVMMVMLMVMVIVLVVVVKGFQNLQKHQQNLPRVRCL